MTKLTKTIEDLDDVKFAIVKDDEVLALVADPDIADMMASKIEDSEVLSRDKDEFYLDLRADITGEVTL